jgi:hypothetical protein
MGGLEFARNAAIYGLFQGNSTSGSGGLEMPPVAPDIDGVGRKPS